MKKILAFAMAVPTVTLFVTLYRIVSSQYQSNLYTVYQLDLLRM